MKKFSTQKLMEAATRCFLIIATAVAMLVVTVNVGKVTVTQLRLAGIYSDIVSSENAREQYQKESHMYDFSGTRAYYQGLADEADAEIVRLEEKRSEIKHSSDPIVAWAAKNGFEHSVFWPFLGISLLTLGLFVIWYKKLEKITNLEVVIFSSVMIVIFSFISNTLYILGKFLYLIAKSYENQKRKCRPKSKSQKIVPFDDRRRLG